MGQMVQAGEHGLTDGRTDKQTNGRYQVQYLPALLSYTVDNDKKNLETA